ncbi:MAG: NUDIX domain-containing protein [Candidatus Moraniibacteriota bacterium]
MIKLVNTVVFLIINEKNQVLLTRKVKKEKSKKESGPVVQIIKKVEDLETKEEWSLLVNNIGDDEDPRTVIRREISKKLGCEAGVCVYFNLYFHPISENFIKKTVYFYGDIKGEASLNEDSTVLEWVDLEKEEIKKLNLPSDQEEALFDFSDFLQRKFLEQID